MFIKEKPFSNWTLPGEDINKVIVAFDSEYQSGSRNNISIGGELINVNQRRLKDIISIQLGFNYRNRSPTLYFMKRDPDDSAFRFSDVIKLLKKYLWKIGKYKEVRELKKLTIELWTFWGGVDLSVFQDYEKILTENTKSKKDTSKIVAIHSNTVFTSQPLKLRISDENRNAVSITKNDKLVIRDMTKLAPGKENLAGLGKLIGVPKIDTEKWDQQDGCPKGYYKAHMTKLWENRQSDFVNYALEDVVVTALYGTFILQFQKQLTDDGFGDFKPLQLKPSLGSIVGSIIGCQNAKSSDWIVDEVVKLLSQLKQRTNNDKDFESFLRTICKPEIKTEKGKVVRDYHFNELHANPTSDDLKRWLNEHLDFDKIRKGYCFPRTDISSDKSHKHLVHDMTNKIDVPLNRMFNDAVNAYNGGYNIVIYTGIIPQGGEKRDWDISSAYSEAGHLLPDIAPGLGAVKFKEFHNLAANQFSRIVKAAEKINGPYTVGVGIFDIEYPSDYKGFVITPKNVNEGPRYFRKIHEVTLSYTDVYTAWSCGAKVFTHRLSFVRQSRIIPGTLDGISQEGHIQDIFQKRREQCVHGSPEDKMNKNVVNQCYGVTAEGLKKKTSPDYNNGRPYYVPFSRITNPLKAIQFTSITRLHIITLQRAIWKIDPKAVFLNNVTDGCLTWTKKPLKIDEIIQSMDQITAEENPWYHDMVHNYFDGKYIKRKDGTDQETANLRTRLTFSRDNQLSAMVGLTKITPKQVFNKYLDQGRSTINVVNHQITGITAMRHEEKFQHLQTSWNQTTDLYFSFDMAQVPINYHQSGQFVYWETRPYNSEDEFNRLWQPGRDVLKYGVWYSAEYAPFFLRFFTELQKGYKPMKFWKVNKKDKKGDSYLHRGTEVYRNWSFYVARNNLDIKNSYGLIIQIFHDHGWVYMRGTEERELPQLQSFRVTIRRIQKNHVKVLPNYVLLHESNLI